MNCLRSSRSATHTEKIKKGFTLVEVMIVIAIVAILASITLGIVRIAQQAAAEAHAKSTVQAISLALKNYALDEGLLPAQGSKPDSERNDFPILYNALQDVKKADGGKGGKSAPYLDNIEEDSIFVMDGEEYVKATRKERQDNKVDKYIVDPWGNPFIYRCNKGIVPLRDYMKNRDYDIYSMGPDEEDDTILGEEDEDSEENDDIGNW